MVGWPSAGAVVVGVPAVVGGATVVVVTDSDRVVDAGSSVEHADIPTSATAAEPLPIVLMKARLVIMASPSRAQTVSVFVRYR